MHPAGNFFSIAALAQTKGRLLSGRRFLGAALVVSVALVGCSSTTEQAPITDLSVAPEAPPVQVIEQSEKQYTVLPGDTLYKIARAHQADVQEIVQANQISDPTQLRVGQTLVIPVDQTAAQAPADISAGSQVATAPIDVSPRPATEPKKAEPEAKADTKQVSPSQTAQATQADSKPAAGSTAPRASDANLVSWGWPNSGKIIQGYTPSSKGIDLEGQVGDPVLAAADGKVMYAGNGVRGLGNLILLGHSDGFITAYAHNDQLLVKMGEEVKKGQKVATLGQSEASSPRLHFEIRRRGTPVNPMSYLPQR